MCRELNGLRVSQRTNDSDAIEQPGLEESEEPTKNEQGGKGRGSVRAERWRALAPTLGARVPAENDAGCEVPSPAIGRSLAARL